MHTHVYVVAISFSNLHLALNANRPSNALHILYKAFTGKGLGRADQNVGLRRRN